MGEDMKDKCKTCGGSRQRPDFHAPTPKNKPFAFKQVPCPDCKPEPGCEFVPKHREFSASPYIKKILTKSLQAENKQLKEKLEPSKNEGHE